MPTYVILSRLSPEAFDDPREFRKIAQTVSAKIKKEAKGVEWKQSYALMGRFDILDIVECEDPDELQRAIMIIRAHGHATTETMEATPWHEFLAEL